eukprot:5024289-Pleurochrysis_carterae.AAC.1
MRALVDSKSGGADEGALGGFVGGGSGESGGVSRRITMSGGRSAYVTLPVRQCTSAGGLVDGETGLESGLDTDPGGDGVGSENGGPTCEVGVAGAASADGAVVVLREYTRRRDSLKTSATSKSEVGRRQSNFGSSLTLSRPARLQGTLRSNAQSPAAGA